MEGGASLKASCENPNNQKVALILGITGQDGSYLTELLLAKNYIVHGVIRRSSSFNTKRLDHLYKDPHNKTSLYLHYGDITDTLNIVTLITTIKPNEIYNLAAQSHVRVSFDIPEYTANVDALGTLRILEGIRAAGLENSCKFYQASTSELFGKVQETPQKETTPFYPRSPYGCAKIFGFWITKNYREAYNIFAVNGILFNHESIRRGETFVTRKISRSVVRIAKGLEECLYLGNLEAKRDWGHAKDYVEAMWLMLQQEKPEDFVIATGETRTVREFCERAFKMVGMPIQWRGKGVDEIGYHVNEKGEEKIVVRIDPHYFRPTEVDLLLGDPTNAEKKLGWKRKVTFDMLIQEMIDGDMEIVNKQIFKEGYKLKDE